MSNGVYVRYLLDPTGANPDNLVANEEHTLSDRAIRFIAPDHGLFYKDSLRVFDGVTLQPLTELQYEVPIINQEASLRFAAEIADCVMIKDSQVSDKAIISYQAVGGNFQNNIQNVINIYESIANDTRMVDWMTGVYGKPSQYPSGPHPHNLADIFGWEALTFMLERIRQAILLSNVPAYETIYQSLMANFSSKEDIDRGVTNRNIVTLEVLQYAAERYNFNKFSVDPMVASIRNNQAITFNVEATTPLESDQLYWEVEHLTSKAADFQIASGTVDMYRGKGSFILQTVTVREDTEDRLFKINFFRGGFDGLKLFSTFELTLKRFNFGDGTVLGALSQCCIKSPALVINPTTLSVHRGVWNAQQS